MDCKYPLYGGLDLDGSIGKNTLNLQVKNMKLELVTADVFSVYVVVHEGKDYDCAHFLSEEWTAPNKSCGVARNKLLTQIEHLAANPRNMSKPLHQICDGIWQLERGQYRIPWFYDKGRVVICTHFFVKKRDKTPESEKERAIKIREEYFRKR